MVVWLLVCLLGVLGLAGCDLGGIPGPQTSDSGLIDAASQICTPNERTCEGLEVISCNSRGTAQSSQACELSTTCIDGACKPVPTRCDQETTDDRLSYSVSKDELVFKVLDPLKTSTASFEITNCGDSPITIQRINFGDQPTDFSILPDVFKLPGASASLNGLQIEPGGRQVVEVSYQPLYAYSRQGGTLKVTIAGPDFQQVWIALTPKVYCVSATPEVDLGLFDDQASRSVTVHNCGTEPVELTNVRIEANTDAAASRVDTSLSLASDPEGDAELPTLESGEHLELDVDLTARQLGALDHQVVVEVADAHQFQDPTPSAKLIGRVVADSCYQTSLDAPRVWGEQFDPAQQWSVDDIPLDKVVYFEMQPEPSLDLYPIFSLSTPASSRAKLGGSTAPLATSAKASFTPDVAGVYEVTMNVIDADGRPMCDPQTLSLHARPTSDFYVDLRWETPDDPISADAGMGYGADLNLYLTATDELSQQPDWDTLFESCYGLGDLLVSGGQEVQSNPVFRAGCQATNAEIRSLSVTDAHREVMVVEEATRRFYQIGVRSWSMYDFSSAHAYLSVYAHGQRVAEIDLPSQWWGSPSDEDYEGHDIDRDDLLHIELSGRQAWQFGVWDAENNRLLPRKKSVYDGRFP